MLYKVAAVLLLGVHETYAAEADEPIVQDVAQPYTFL